MDYCSLEILLGLIPETLSVFAVVGILFGQPQRLYVILSTSVTQEQFTHLFDIAPGMIHCELKRHHTSGASRGFGYVTYSSPAQAQYAREKISAVDYPPGNRIVIKFAEDPPSFRQAATALPSSPAVMNPLPMSPSSVVRPASNLSLAEGAPPSFAQGISARPEDNLSGAEGSTMDMAESEARLFIVCTPTAPSDSILRSVFGHFGSLIEVYTVRDHNYGYARYSNPQSAELALQHLHGAEVAGSRLKVVHAEPPPVRGSDEPSRKRPRT